MKKNVVIAICAMMLLTGCTSSEARMYDAMEKADAEQGIEEAKEKAYKQGYEEGYEAAKDEVYQDAYDEGYERATYDMESSDVMNVTEEQIEEILQHYDYYYYKDIAEKYGY